MSLGTAARRGASTIVLAAAIVLGTTGCGQPATTAGATPTAGPSTAASPATSTAADPTAAAGADASAAPLAVDPGDQSVDGPQISQAVSDELTRVVGRSPDSVTCPALPAKVGATIRCELVATPDTYGLTVTATSVQGGNVAFDIKVDDQPS